MRLTGEKMIDCHSPRNVATLAMGQVTVRSCPPLRVHLRRSRFELALLAALHLFALPMPWLSALPLAARVVIDLVLLISAAYYVRRWLRFPYTGLRLLPDGAWALASGDIEAEAVLMPGGYRTVHLVVLPLRTTEQRTIRLVLWPDSASPDELRRLRAWLRWGASAVQKGQSGQVGAEP